MCVFFFLFFFFWGRGEGREREEGFLGVLSFRFLEFWWWWSAPACLPACMQSMNDQCIHWLHACMQQSFGFLPGCNQTNKEWVLIICFLLGFFQFFGDLSLSLSPISFLFFCFLLLLCLFCFIFTNIFLLWNSGVSFFLTMEAIFHQQLLLQFIVKIRWQAFANFALMEQPWRQWETDTETQRQRVGVSV